MTMPVQRLLARFFQRYRQGVAQKREEAQLYASVLAERPERVITALFFHLFQALRGLLIVVGGIALSAIALWGPQIVNAAVTAALLVSSLFLLLIGLTAINSSLRKGIRIYFDVNEIYLTAMEEDGRSAV
ncbi:hypothetical protein F6X54_26510 [Micromonospora aurantiaca]|uniref:Uncharacterized protein n=1 Tax=Micromonospora aurantiaca (nom. illeg.) TaxID=47850 RepID=A0ABQ6U9T5_9ACTN|nr:hypothetical protein [Micromonospora aurantiaca]KAB1107472.1 hypothetical protein F6X54_26510 [Micromonospora aurantiaca]